MNRTSSLFFFLVLPVLVSCAGSPERPHAAADRLPDAPQQREEDIIYRLLLAEIAGQRGKLDVSVDNLSQVAAELDNVDVAERATRVAIYAKDFPVALQMAKHCVLKAPIRLISQIFCQDYKNFRMGFRFPAMQSAELILY